MPPHSHSHSHDANGHRISADTQLATIHATFDRYVPHALSVNNRRRKDYFSLEKRCQDLLPGYATSSLSPTDGSEARGEGGLLKEVDNAIRANGIFLKAMLEGSGVFLAESMDGKVDAEDEGERGGVDGAEAPSEMDFGKLASTLRQCVRDWSVEGKAERETIYLPIIDALENHYCSLTRRERAGIKVLVPGAGLARLAFDIVKSGFSCQANEFSMFMLIASNFILNETTEMNQYKLHPFIHSFSNIPSNATLLQPIYIPDVLPLSLNDHEYDENDSIAGENKDEEARAEFSVAAGDFNEVYGGAAMYGVHDAIVTCFFLDTAKNVLEYLTTIKNTLKRGGLWINCGPTLWHHENSSPSIELTLKDLKSLSRRMGFRIIEERSIETSYASNPAANMRTVYQAAFWIAIYD